MRRDSRLSGVLHVLLHMVEQCGPMSMRPDAVVPGDCVGWASGDAPSAKQVASPKLRAKPERHVGTRLLDLKSFELVW
jgi:hypothetical protein